MHTTKIHVDETHWFEIGGPSLNLVTTDLAGEMVDLKHLADVADTDNPKVARFREAMSELDQAIEDLTGIPRRRLGEGEDLPVWEAPN